jgi:Spy/CpxP family protein refolding chaperone
MMRRAVFPSLVRFLPFLAPLLALAALSGAAAADPATGAPAPPATGTGGPGPGRPGFWHHGPPPIDGLLERHADELGLDAATTARIHDIAAQARAAALPLHDDMRALHQAMHTLLSQDAPNSDDVMQLADSIGAAETELHKRRLETMLEIRALLTPDQRAKLVQIFQAHRARWRARAAGQGGVPAPGTPAPGTPTPGAPTDATAPAPAPAP